MSTHKTMELSDSPPAIAGRTFPEKLRLSVGLQEEFLQWIELVPPQRTLRHLRKMLFAWMLREQSGFPTDFEEMITDLDCLFELLDSIQDEMTEEWESRPFEKEKMRGGANMNDENMNEEEMNE
jgi:hypothetical protein